MLADTWPSMGSTLGSETWACGVGAVACATIVAARNRSATGWHEAWKALLVGAGLLALPACGAALRGVAGEPLNRTAALCFVPVMVAVLSGIADDGPSPEWWPGLAGLGGALLIFPLTLPSSVAGYAGLLLPGSGVAVACVFGRRLQSGAPWTPMWLLAGGAGGLAVLEAGRRVAGGASGQNFSPWAVVLDALVAGLTVFLVSRVSGLRYASRYFAVPLLTILEGLALGVSGLTLRLGIGLLLLAAAVVAVWRARLAGEGTTLGLA